MQQDQFEGDYGSLQERWWCLDKSGGGGGQKLTDWWRAAPTQHSNEIWDGPIVSPISSWGALSLGSSPLATCFILHTLFAKLYVERR